MQEVKEITVKDEISRFQRLKVEWQKAKETKDIPFYEYTDSLISDIEVMLSSNDLTDESVGLNKLFKFNYEFEKIHIPGFIDLNYILSFSSTPDKIRIFLQYNNQLNDNEYWTRLSEVYQLQDYNPVPYGVLKALFTNDRKGRENLMKEEEREFFETLPDEILIFRAMSLKEFESGEFRISWTLKEPVAKKFKKRNEMLYEGEHVIHSISVLKKDVIAYLNDSEEHEIIYLHNCS
jgi:hypothetical protein